jgi:thioredoxin-like negative regulator of GroEL
MKRLSTLIVTLLLLFSSAAYSQVMWLNSEKLAKAVAIERDQLILMDFWATWCGPCRKMDNEMWDTEEFKELSKNFVALKIDIDVERDLANEYYIKSIPHVVLVNSAGDILWQKTGYSDASPYKEILEDLPTNFNGINADLMSLSEEFKDDEYFSIGDKYLELALESGDEFKRVFLSQSDRYLKEITKNSDNQDNINKAEMKLLLNDAYHGKYKRAIRKVEKMEINKDEELADMKQFIKAYCFKCEGDDTSFEKAKAQIKSTEYLSQLDKN